VLELAAFGSGFGGGNKYPQPNKTTIESIAASKNRNCVSLFDVSAIFLCVIYNFIIKICKSKTTSRDRVRLCKKADSAKYA